MTLQDPNTPEIIRKIVHLNSKIDDKFDDTEKWAADHWKFILYLILVASIFIACIDK